MYEKNCNDNFNRYLCGEYCDRNLMVNLIINLIDMLMKNICNDNFDGYLCGKYYIIKFDRALYGKELWWKICMDICMVNS